MAIPIINNWQSYFEHENEGLGSSYERVILSDILLETVNRFGIQTILETPSFGFTGLSGINLMEMAKLRLNVALEDHDHQRLELIKALWLRAGLSCAMRYNPDYRVLDYPDKSFDLGFCFSALWFCSELKCYLKELARVSSRCILICVPNRQGLGYKSQVADYDPVKYPSLRISHIDPASVISLLKKEGWKLVEKELFDCPPWPDIGMSKEDFLSRKIGLRLPQKAAGIKLASAEKKVSIMEYYEGRDPSFAQRMRKLAFVEKTAPLAFKRIWTHHLYLLFTPQR